MHFHKNQPSCGLYVNQHVFFQFYSRFFPCWKEHESTQNQLLHFSLDEGQWEEDWAILLSLASQPGSSLEQVNVLMHMCMHFYMCSVDIWKKSSLTFLISPAIFVTIILIIPIFISSTQPRGHLAVIYFLDAGTNHWKLKTGATKIW